MTRTRTRTGALLLTASLFLTACAGPSTSVNPDPPSPTTPPTAPPSEPPVPAGPVLTRLADTLTDAPADTTNGKYQYTERRTWYRDIIGPPGPTGWPLRVRFEQLWRTDDATNGRHLSVQTTANGCAPDEGDTRWADSTAHQFNEPTPRTPAELRAYLLAVAGDRTGPEHIIGGVAMLYERYAPTRPVRTAILRLLAKQPGLLVQTGVVDRAQRPGIDVILPHTDQSGVPQHDILTIDPTSGVLLAAHTTITGPIPPQDPDRGPDVQKIITADADSYRLYIDNRRTPSTRTPAAGCHHPAALPSALDLTGP
ncbi:hypothetical protein [Micromonospora sp. DT233]|uniref:hypothetical protein n=1 Tax=Micromonospora sp. DT233 TaxID=3393432 RepID=UPI003CF8EBC1